MRAERARLADFGEVDSRAGCGMVGCRITELCPTTALCLSASSILAFRPGLCRSCAADAKSNQQPAALVARDGCRCVIRNDIRYEGEKAIGRATSPCCPLHPLRRA